MVCSLCMKRYSWLTLFFFPTLFLRVHQHTRAVLQHILHVLSHRAGHMAGVLPAALLQGEEADRVERAPWLLTPGGRKLPASQPTTHPNIHPLWTSFSKTTASGVWGAQILVFTAVKRKSTKVVLWKKKKKKEKRFTCLFSGLKHEKRCREKCTVRPGRLKSVSTAPHVSVCTVSSVAASWIRTCSF